MDRDRKLGVGLLELGQRTRESLLEEVSVQYLGQPQNACVQNNTCMRLEYYHVSGTAPQRTELCYQLWQ